MLVKGLSKETNGLLGALKDCFLNSGEDEPNVRRVRRLYEAVVANESAAATIRKGRCGYKGYTVNRARLARMKRHRMYLAPLLTSAPPVYPGKWFAKGN